MNREQHGRHTHETGSKQDSLQTVLQKTSSQTLAEARIRLTEVPLQRSTQCRPTQHLPTNRSATGHFRGPATLPLSKKIVSCLLLCPLSPSNYPLHSLQVTLPLTSLGITLANRV